MKKLVLKEKVEKILVMLIFSFIAFVVMTIESGLDNFGYVVGIALGGIVCALLMKVLKHYGKDF